MTPEYDIAIVGCGPVGAVAANLFGQAGLKTLVLEQALEPHPLPRAVHLDHEMMRIFQSLDLIPVVEPLMRATHGHVHIGADGGVIRYLGAHGRPKRFGWSNDYFFYQPELEAALRDALGRYASVDLRLGRTLSQLTQDADGVDLAGIDHDAAAWSARARYVVACDGSRSAVRSAIGVKLDDLKFEEPWLVVDADVEGPITFPDFAGLPVEADLQNLSVMLCDPRRPATIVPGRGAHRRWEFMLLPGEDDQEMMRPDRVAALVAPWVQGRTHTITRAATYRFHGLVAEQWRVGRVMLAGDAAHQTPPFFGQGMCHGLRDVANLAWKLKLVLAGRAEAALLDTYQVERDPHVRAVIGAAVAAGRYICLLDPQAAAERDLDLRAKMKDAAPATAADLIPAIQAGVVTPGSGERFIQPYVLDRDGTRVLLDEATNGGFRLLVSDPDLVAALSSVQRSRLHELEVAIVPVTAGAQPTPNGVSDVDGDLAAWLAQRGAKAALIRPDFYVFGTAATEAQLQALVEDLDRAVSSSQATPARQEEAVPCRA